MNRVKDKPSTSVELTDEAVSSASYYSFGTHPAYVVYSDEKWKAQRYHKVKLLAEEMSAIFTQCNRKAEPLVINYPTGLKHTRLLSIQRYMSEVPYEGMWMPFTDLLRFVALPRLIPRQIVVDAIAEDLTRESPSIHRGWKNWAKRYGQDIDGDDSINEDSSADEIYDYLLSAFKGRYTTMKPTKSMENIRAWGGSEMRDRTEHFHPDWASWDIVIPLRIDVDTQLSVWKAEGGQYGYFNAWAELLYADVRDYVEDDYGGRQGITHSIFQEKTEDLFLQGIITPFTTPLMFEGYDFHRKPPKKDSRKSSEHKIISSNPWMRFMFNDVSAEYQKYIYRNTPFLPPPHPQKIPFPNQWLIYPYTFSPAILRQSNSYSLLWFLMTALDRWFPSYLSKEMSPQYGADCFVATLREDNTMEDIYNILKPVAINEWMTETEDYVEKSQMYEDRVHHRDVMDVVTVEGWGRGDLEMSHDDMQANIEALGGFIQLKEGKLTIGLGMWGYDNGFYDKSYRYDHIISPQEQYEKRDRDASMSVTVDDFFNTNPTPLVLDSEEIQRAFVFVPKRPLKGAYGVVNHNFAKALFDSRHWWT